MKLHETAAIRAGLALCAQKSSTVERERATVEAPFFEIGFRAQRFPAEQGA
jgi:hypothetical protein